MPLPSSCRSLCLGQSSLPWVLRSVLSSFESLLRLPLRWSNSCITPFHGTTAPYYHSATVSQYHEHMFTELISLLDFYICVTLGNVYLHRVQRACLVLLCFHLALCGKMSAPLSSRNSVFVEGMTKWIWHSWLNLDNTVVFYSNFNLLTWKSCQMISILFTPWDYHVDKTMWYVKFFKLFVSSNEICANMFWIFQEIKTMND